MQKHRSIKIVFLTCFAASVAFFMQTSAIGAAEKDISSNLKDISMRMTYYYKNPDVNGAIEAIKLTLKETVFIEDELHADAAAHFFATALQADRSKVNDLRALMALSTDSQKKFLTKIIEGTENFRSLGMNDPQDMDFAWSEFLATGKAEPVKKIIKVFSYTPESIEISAPYWEKQGITSNKMALMMMQGTAEWSLASNAAQHERVKEIIAIEMKTTTDEKLKKKLQAILSVKPGFNPGT